MLDIIFENEDFIVLNKPAGLLSIPDRMGKEVSLKSLLQEKYESIYTVHRLDQLTSGLILFAKNAEAHQTLSQLFEGRDIVKKYVGIVLGQPSTEGTIDAPIMEHAVKKGMMIVHAKGKTALTSYRLLQQFKWYAFMEFQIHTGRTHQIRVHAKHIGHPIVCDELYGDGQPILLSNIKKKNFKLSQSEEAERPLLNRQALHAFSVDFEYKKEKLHFEASLPKDVQATLRQLEKWNK
jgi:23S rRNA pseudouridine955/2504/2580 synthase/23S rRNA pseudouridine1911/1915/1917 synthase